AKTPKLGPMWWIKCDIKERIDASWGSREEWESIPDWKNMDLSRPSDINPGVKEIIASGDPAEVRTYTCETCGHEYKMKTGTKDAGHGCPVCLKARVKL
ncbi:MAG: hypothetical protein K2K98_11775, partial [Muribaculaceae bacterium]|nr:hypothetical protein [Muribaculaceae bacterium]